MPKSKASSNKVKNHVTIDFEGLSESEKATLRDRGLIQEGVNVNHISRRPIFMEPKFSTTPHFTHQYLALEPELTGKVLKVFHYVCSILEFDNWEDFSTVWIAEKILCLPSLQLEAIVINSSDEGSFKPLILEELLIRLNKICSAAKPLIMGRLLDISSKNLPERA